MAMFFLAYHPSYPLIAGGFAKQCLQLVMYKYLYVYLEYQLDVFFLGCSCFWSKTKNFWKTHFWCHIVVLWCCFFVLWCRVFGCVSLLLACVMFLVETKKKTSNGGPGIYIYIHSVYIHFQNQVFTQPSMKTLFGAFTKIILKLWVKRSLKSCVDSIL